MACHAEDDVNTLGGVGRELTSQPLRGRNRAVLSYVELVRQPGVASLTASQLTARFPLGMLAIALVLHVHARTGSYGVAGLVTGVFSLGEACGSPFAGRLLGSIGSKPVLLGSAILCASAITVLAVVPCTPAEYLIVGAVGGLAVPPVLPAIRSIYPLLVPEEMARTLFTVDASLQEIIWIVGPLMTTVLALGVSTAMPLLVAAAMTVGGVGWLAGSRALTGISVARSERRFGRALVAGSVLPCSLTIFLLVASFGALEVGVLDRETGHTGTAGLAIALASLGSLVGGLALGPHLHGRLALVGALGVVCLFTGVSGLFTAAIPLCSAMFASGIGFAPAISMVSQAVSTSVPKSEAPEAFGWLNTGALAGLAAGTSAAGVIADVGGTGQAFWAATAFAACAIAVSLPISTRQPRSLIPEVS